MDSDHIQPTAHAYPPSVEDMGVEHHRTDILMVQQF